MKYNYLRINEMAKNLFQEERALNRLDGWFILREKMLEYELEHKGLDKETLLAKSLQEAIKYFLFQLAIIIYL